MGLVCLLATCLDERIEATGIDGMFSSFVQLVGHGFPASQIPGMLRVADVAHLIHAAGSGRIQMNRLQKSEYSTAIESSKRPPSSFFEEWIGEDTAHDIAVPEAVSKATGDPK
jgi:hypothetical protein